MFLSGLEKLCQSLVVLADTCLGSLLDCALVKGIGFLWFRFVSRQLRMFFLSGLERSCASHGVLADTWGADWIARS